MDKRVFTDQNGKFYASPDKLNPSDSESNFPTEDMKTVLTLEPVTREVMIQKIIDLGNARTAAVLAPEVNPVVESGAQVSSGQTILTLVPPPAS